jgi:hypothetical protein
VGKNGKKGIEGRSEKWIEKNKENNLEHIFSCISIICKYTHAHKHIYIYTCTQKPINGTFL